MKNLLCIVAVCFAVLASTAWAAQPDRISAAIDSHQTVVLKGSVSPLAQPQSDLGPLDPSTRLPYVTLVLQPSTAQQAALTKLLAEQQDPTSPNYHKWLSPEQFGQRFGLSHNDLAKISAWLQSQGFGIAEVARGRNWIAISGTVAQIQSALHTQMHRFKVDGEERFANATAISVPKALDSIAVGFRGLNNFKLKPMMVKRSSISPDYTSGSGNNLAPDDIATIFDIDPLYTAGTNGTGMKLAVMGQTDIQASDITQFRTGFNLPAIKLTQVLPPGCSDPGITGDEGEADLDLEWSGAVARDASIFFVRCDIKTNSGVITAFQYTVNNNTAPVISMSYGACEADIGSAYLKTTYEPLVVQANTQGQTLMVSSDDSGGAGCDDPNGNDATWGLAVNGLASPPEVTAVGGTEFNEGTGTYWNPTNGANGGSAKSYIPELAWDDSNSGTGLNGGGLPSSGGGASIYFNRPSWQTGTGKFNATFRSVPDISMPASADHDGYIFCTAGSCAAGIAQAVANNSIVGGTSVACPVFAGIVTLLNQSQGNAPPKGMGNINPSLYQLVQSVPTAFHDVPAGDYNISGATANPSGNMVPCTQGSTNCPAKAPFQIGFLTGTGYDEVTGLGSVDADVFVTNWSGSGSLRPTTTTLTLQPTFVDVGSAGPVVMKAVVKPSSGSGTPTGTVTFYNGSTQVGTGTLSAGTATYNYNTSALTAATYPMTATYNGDATFAGSTSTAANLDVVDFQLSAPNPTTVTISAPGQSGSTVITITPLGGFSQTPSFSCSPLPSETTCIASGTATLQTITFTTTAASRLQETPFGRHAGVFYAMLLPGLFGLVWPAGNRKRIIRLVALIAILACLTLWMPACGGGSSSTPPNPGTPVGTTTVTITATSGTLQHKATVTLTVQ